jgi:hypothetical protein
MKCATSSRQARRVRALFCLASQMSSSGIRASWATVEMRLPPATIGTGKVLLSLIIR